MPITDLCFRQIHLDFHTSPHIPAVGSDFDPEEFADKLVEAHVDSVTVFARCHHGHLYYDSKLNPERIHPTLTNYDLLIQQIEACHQRNIRVPIYTTVQWDQFTSDEHRDWLCIDEQGTEFRTPPLQAGFYRTLDVFHPGYREFLKRHTAEIFEMMPVDGIFYDIVQPQWSLAKHWLDAMDNAGVDPEDVQARIDFSTKILNEWKLEMTQFIQGLPQYDQDNCTIFYNAGHVGPRHRTTVEAYTHYELESLPSGGWGYLHFPLAMRYARGLDKLCLGMTGKFHTSWGDFHSYKNQAALEFECFHMLALGARCSIGDQLHPSGKIDAATYKLIGSVYGSVEAKEPWCRDAEPVAEIGVLTPEEFGSRKSAFAAMAENQPEAAMGAVRMLQELGRQFDILTTDRDFSPYKLLILPDQIPVDDDLADKLRNYLASGGKLIATWKSGLDASGDRFMLEDLGVKITGDAQFSPDFLVPSETFGVGLEPTSYVMYEKGVALETTAETQILAGVESPYFNRTYRHFCSHRHTPSTGETTYPGVVRHGSYIHFMHPIFRQYQRNAPRWCRVLLGNAIELLIGKSIVDVQGPTSVINTLSYQAHDKRHVLHLLHYQPERRGTDFDTIEDVIPLHDTQVSIELGHKPSTVKLVPAGEDVAFEYSDDGRVTFVVPRIVGHAMIEIA